jgi:signal peptidase I
MRETRELLDAPELNLAAEVLASGGTIRLRVRGSSMLPSLWPGDIVTIESTSCAAAVPGDLVLVRRNVLHRVKEKHDCAGRLCLITCGDAVPHSDPPVESSELLGRVARIQRNQRILVPQRQLSVAARLLAWICRSDRFRSICLRLHACRQSWGPQASGEIG